MNKYYIGNLLVFNIHLRSAISCHALTNSSATNFHCHIRSDPIHLISCLWCLEGRVFDIFTTITHLFLYHCALKCSRHINVRMKESHRGQQWSLLSTTELTLGRHSLWGKWSYDTAAGRAGLLLTCSGSLPLAHLCIWKIIIMENSLTVILITCSLSDQYDFASYSTQEISGHLWGSS